MMMTRDDRSHGPADPDRAVAQTGLDAAFATLRTRRAAPDAALVARVMADAAAQMTGATLRHPAGRPGAAPGGLQPGPARPARSPTRPAGTLRRGRRWRGLATRAPMPAGLAAALMIGVWIGVAVPVPVPMLEEALFGPLPFVGEVEPADLFAE